MNEILSVIYFTFKKDDIFNKTVEVDCFFTFTILMAECKDCFIKNLDSADTGILAKINILNNLLKKTDF
jgi:hypothetical protein